MSEKEELEQDGDVPFEVPEDPRAAFVERFAADLTEAGMQRMAARAFACLLISEEGALTSAELAERLQVSPAAVSGAVRSLSQMHMVSRERQPGSRRERYRLHQSVWYESMANYDPLISRWMVSLRWGVESVGSDTPAGHRLTETADFLLFMREELDGLIERWEQRRRGAAAEPRS